MKMILEFKSHPKYEAALGIIRAKITGAASDVLINNKMAYNIDAIIERLDLSYADQRPLYVVEAEMTSIKQLGRTLQEYYDSINQALNMVLTKIALIYKNEKEQKSLIAEAQQKAVRAFIIGLKSQMMRNILYGQTPKTLADAFAVAQTVYYDNQYLQLDQNRDSRTQHQQSVPMKSKPNWNYNKPQQRPIQPKVFNKTEPMEVDSSNRFKQATNWRKPNQQPNAQMYGPQKRDYNFSHQYTQQPHKFQKINQLRDSESDPNDGYEGDICGEIPDDLISNTSHESIESNTASTFLSA